MMASLSVCGKNGAVPQRFKSPTTPLTVSVEDGVLTWLESAQIAPAIAPATIH
jgi:hypothetical protein|tara:strand:+ start:23 stop:181 length:159 start_codon:yes stop_codon:yes gene_type:complete